MITIIRDFAVDPVRIVAMNIEQREPVEVAPKTMRIDYVLFIYLIEGREMSYVYSTLEEALTVMAEIVAAASGSK